MDWKRTVHFMEVQLLKLWPQNIPCPVSVCIITSSDPLVQEGNKGPSSADLTSDNKATPMETERPEEPQKGDPDAKRKQEVCLERVVRWGGEENLKFEVIQCFVLTF